MYWLDTAILAIVAIGAVFGAVSGLLMQLARLVGFAVALYAAVVLNDGATALCQNTFMRDAEPWLCHVVAYILVFLLTYLTIFVMTLLLERGLRGARLQALNRGLGALLGAVKAGLILGAVLLGLTSFPHAATRELLDRSALGPPLARGVELLVSAVVGQYGEDLRGGVEDAARGAAPKILEQLNALED
jgi:membrane protein required for colicin V production